MTSTQFFNGTQFEHLPSSDAGFAYTCFRRVTRLGGDLLRTSHVDVLSRAVSFSLASVTPQDGIALR